MPPLIYIIILILGIFLMNMSKFDLNLLVYLDVLLRECNVTRAAEELGISQPAMSNSLRRLRDLFADPILVRTSDGMTPTERALELQPLVRTVLEAAEQAVLPKPNLTLRHQPVFLESWQATTLKQLYCPCCSSDCLKKLQMYVLIL